MPGWKTLAGAPGCLVLRQRNTSAKPHISTRYPVAWLLPLAMTHMGGHIEENACKS